MPDPSLADVEAALEEKLPSHTFRAVVSLADSFPPDEREARLRTALENRERDEEWTRERKSRGTSDVAGTGGRSSAGRKG